MKTMSFSIVSSDVGTCRLPSVLGYRNPMASKSPDRAMYSSPTLAPVCALGAAGGPVQIGRSRTPLLPLRRRGFLGPSAGVVSARTASHKSGAQSKRGAQCLTCTSSRAAISGTSKRKTATWSAPTTPRPKEKRPGKHGCDTTAAEKSSHIATRETSPESARVTPSSCETRRPIAPSWVGMTSIDVSSSRSLPRVDMGEGPTLLALHAYGMQARAYLPLAQELHHRLRVVIPDLFALSQWRELWTFQHLRDCLMYTLDDLGIERVTVIGHSFGGGLALGLASQRADRIDECVFVDTLGPKRQLSLARE